MLLTHDSLQFLAPRFVAMRDAFKDMPGVVIVADISPVTVDEAGGAAMMRTILLADPDIDVVLGADTVVLGALAALREAGKARTDQFLGGIDGEPAAVNEIKSGGPYKASVSLASPIFSYAMGQHAADWLEGKRIPQAMDILPRALTPNNIASYEADLADPAAVYNDPSRRDQYLRMYGNICLTTVKTSSTFPGHPSAGSRGPGAGWSPSNCLPRYAERATQDRLSQFTVGAHAGSKDPFARELHNRLRDRPIFASIAPRSAAAA